MNQDRSHGDTGKKRPLASGEDLDTHEWRNRDDSALEAPVHEEELAIEKGVRREEVEIEDDVVVRDTSEKGEKDSEDH